MRFRFTIRDLLWLTVVVALCVAWYLDHWRQSDMWWIIEQRNGQTIITDRASREEIYRFDKGRAFIRGTRLIFMGWFSPKSPVQQPSILSPSPPSTSHNGKIEL
jgi:hypothetical protein